MRLGDMNAGESTLHPCGAVVSHCRTQARVVGSSLHVAARQKEYGLHPLQSYADPPLIADRTVGWIIVGSPIKPLIVSWLGGRARITSCKTAGPASGACLVREPRGQASTACEAFYQAVWSFSA